MECLYHPEPDLRDCGPWQPTDWQTRSRKVAAVTHWPSLKTLIRITIFAYRDAVKRWSIHKADWKHFCSLADESVVRFPPLLHTTSIDKSSAKQFFSSSDGNNRNGALWAEHRWNMDGRKRARAYVHWSQTSAPALLKWLWTNLIASGAMSDFSVPAYSNGVWHLLRLTRVAQRNKPFTMLYFTVQSIDLRMEHNAWASGWRDNRIAEQPVPYEAFRGLEAQLCDGPHLFNKKQCRMVSP